MCVCGEGEEGVYHNKIKMDKFNFFPPFLLFLTFSFWRVRNITEELTVIIKVLIILKSS